MLGTGQVGDFRVEATATLPEVGEPVPALGLAALPGLTFPVVDLTVIDGAQFTLNGHNFDVSEDLTLSGNDDVINGQANAERGNAADPFSQIAFVGGEESMINVGPGFTLLGDDVDIRVNKTDASVSVMGGAIGFDDEFDGTPSTSTDNINDETLYLESGTLKVGEMDEQQTVYIRLDHENTPLTSFDVDGGQGFVLVGSEGLDASAQVAGVDAYIAGNVRKRVANTGTATPGRVIFPTGEMADADETDRDYAPFTFDF